MFEILPEGICDIFIRSVSKLHLLQSNTLSLEAFMIRHNMQFEIGIGGQVEDVCDLL